MDISKPDDLGVADWVKKVPLEKSPHLDAMTARDTTSLHWTYSNFKHLVFGNGHRRGDLYLPSPFQDTLDRPELFTTGFVFSALPFGVLMGMLRGNTNSKRMMVASIMNSSLKYFVSFLMLGAAFQVADRSMLELSRRAAARQGRVLAKNEDVARTPLNYAVMGACGLSLFTFMDTMRPVPLLYNWSRWAAAGALVGYAHGHLRCYLLASVAREGGDVAVAAAMRDSLYQETQAKAREQAAPKVFQQG
eukprot:Rhum_TRINITY_DN5238_c0_g1::Rhum_TRINITY_DN5238_c0_g1_i1::g.16922::m.16922